MQTKNRKRNKKSIGILVVASMFVLLFWVCGIYVSNYYHADQTSINSFVMHESDAVVQTVVDGNLVYMPENAKTGMIFYPGGKVDHMAYVPLMKACASRGILCVLVQVPFRLAVLDINAADGIVNRYPDIENWYIGGHSLGGSMAATYAKKHSNEYRGLILLGSYSTTDLSETSLAVLSVYGSEDRVLNLKKYEKYKTNLPTEMTEIVLNGGCHAYFGMYGKQDGDGIPSITNEEQIQMTTEQILTFINKK